MAYQHILVPVDGSETSFAAIQHAAELSKALNSKITIAAVLTIDPFIGVEFINTKEIADSYIDQVRHGIKAILEQTQEKFNSLGVSVDTLVLEGQVIHKEIITAATEIQADLIIMGSHGRKGLKKFVLGSVAQSVLGETPIPVLVVRG